jgi:hypothetical protein
MSHKETRTIIVWATVVKIKPREQSEKYKAHGEKNCSGTLLREILRNKFSTYYSILKP